MNDGRIKGMDCIGQNPATSLNAKLEWLVVKGNWPHETAMFWKTAPEVQTGEVATADIATEVLFFPSSQVAEYDGSFTNTQRLLQWHYKAADPPGDCRSDMYFTYEYELGKRLQRLYADSTLPRGEGFQRLVWDYASDDARERQRGEPGSEKILKEINGCSSDDPGRHLAGTEDLSDDGSTRSRAALSPVPRARSPARCSTNSGSRIAWHRSRPGSSRGRRARMRGPVSFPV